MCISLHHDGVSCCVSSRCFVKTSRCPLVFIVSDSLRRDSGSGFLFPREIQVELDINSIRLQAMHTPDHDRDVRPLWQSQSDPTDPCSIKFSPYCGLVRENQIPDNSKKDQIWSERSLTRFTLAFT